MYTFIDITAEKNYYGTGLDVSKNCLKITYKNAINLIFTLD